MHHRGGGKGGREGAAGAREEEFEVIRELREEHQRLRSTNKCKG